MAVDIGSEALRAVMLAYLRKWMLALHRDRGMCVAKNAQTIDYMKKWHWSGGSH
ncbi:hypothetical protein MJ575_11620 [Klebsiella pneumoniae]|nr:hypothetical protein MJ575_11620 [Klebsiella pneumoniae]